MNQLEETAATGHPVVRYTVRAGVEGQGVEEALRVCGRWTGCKVST